MKTQIIDILKSWKTEESTVNSTEELIKWIQNLNETTHVRIEETQITDDTFWFYDDYEGEILNRKRSFFSIKGIRQFVNGKFQSEQPVIIQPEIGYLGIICKKIDGVMHFLMQAKIEPGNINCVQISPTIQATKSNFLRAHGGSLPKYFEYFEHSAKYNVIYDQIQSEQSSRFFRKRNRNMIMEVTDDIEIYPNFKWMTLGQIKKLMEIDNLVNMDTRTVLSGIPVTTQNFNEDELKEIEQIIGSKELFQSMFNESQSVDLRNMYQYINDYKMFNDVKRTTIPLFELVDWNVSDKGVDCTKNANFNVRFYDIEISGREVQNWVQPLFKAIGKAEFSLMYSDDSGVREYLVKAVPEIGTFDKVEIGPTVQLEPSHRNEDDDPVERYYHELLEKKHKADIDVMLSEEGGRFYHEENRNTIFKVNKKDVEITDKYFWVNYSTLNMLIQVNNCINIQLRNLLSLLKL